MAEAIISRRYDTNLKQISTLVKSQLFIPISSGLYKVTTIGGDSINGENKGEVKTKIISLDKGEKIDCYIGSSENELGSSGGITSFGTYLSSNGGSGSIFFNRTKNTASNGIIKIQKV